MSLFKIALITLCLDGNVQKGVASKVDFKLSIM